MKQRNVNIDILVWYLVLDYVPHSSGSHKNSLLLLLANAWVYLLQHFHFFFCSQWFWDLFQSIKDGTVRVIFCSLYFKHKYLISLHQVLMMLHSVLSTLITNRGNFALFFVCTYDIAPLLRLKGWGQRCKHNLPCLYDHFILSLWKLRPPIRVSIF